MKGLMSKISVMFDLAEEIILNTRFDDADRMREIIQEIKSRMEMGISQSGHVVASQRLFSYFSKIGIFNLSISQIQLACTTLIKILVLVAKRMLGY